MKRNACAQQAPDLNRKTDFLFGRGGAAALVRALMLALVGWVALWLPAIGSAQTLPIPAWQKAVKDMLPSQTGCFQASYPSNQWQQVPCTQPQNIVPPWQPPVNTRTTRSTPISGQGPAATAVGGPIQSATGSIINASNVTNITNPPYGSDAYSLQINTDYFTIPSNNSICNSSSDCKGWVQFVYQSFGVQSGVISIWYWIFGASVCPSSTWGRDSSGVCGSFIAQNVPGQPIASFNNQAYLNGQSANGVDAVTLTIGGQAYTIATPSAITVLPQLWQQAQFNVFGSGNDAIANFNDGSSLTIRTEIDNGTTYTPLCSISAGTGESNNLNYNSPCCPYGGGEPSIAFVEGTATAETLTCASLGNNIITPSAGPNGTISPAATLNVPNNVASIFTVTPNAGYQIASVSGCGGSLSGNIFTTAPATASCTVTAAFTPVLYTVTASAGTGGAISPSGAVSVASGTTRAFTLTPNSGYVVSSVGGTCNGTLSGNTYTTKAIAANCTVTAVFAPQTHIVTASAGAGGSISPSGAFTVNVGAGQTFTLSPSLGYVSSSVGGTCGGALNGNTYTTKAITGNCTVTAAFVKTYTVTVSAGTGGAISPSGAISGVAPGTTQTFTLTPNSGYAISVGGTCGGTLSGNTYTTKAIGANCTVTATFTPKTYTVTASAGTGGTISPSGSITGVAAGTTKTFTLKPGSGYVTASASGTCGGTLSGNTYTTNAINSNCTVTAAFTPVYTITASAGTGGAISPSGTISGIAPGTTRTFTVTPSSGYVISSIGGTCGGTLNGSTYATNAITANCTVTAAFAKTYTITTSAGTGGAISPSGTTNGVVSGTTRTFTITPNSGYVLSSTGGSCGGTLTGNNTYTTKAVTSNCTVAATFTPTYAVTIIQTVGGTISPSSVSGVTSGTTQTFTVTPFGGYALSSVGGTCGGTLKGSTYTTKAITANCTVIATFTPQTYTITASVGTGGEFYGSIRTQDIISGLVPGTMQIIDFVSDPGYLLSSVGGTCGGTLNTIISGGSVYYYYTTKPIAANCTVTAAFAPQTYTITVSAGTGGTISPTGNISVVAPGAKTFTVKPNSGYVASVGGTCGGALNGTTYTISAVVANCAVMATFTQVFTVTASAGSGGTISPSGTISSVPVGTVKTFTVTPGSGYVLSSVGGTCGGTLNGNTYTTKAIAANCTVTAAFTR